MEEATSYFGRRLQNEPDLRKRTDEAVRALRNAAHPDLEAIERSQQLTAADFQIIINARAPGQ